MKLRLAFLVFIFVACSEPEKERIAVTGTASYYADFFEGRETGNGEIFSQNKLTAAHKTLAFGTMVKITNLSNQKEVVVKINDRLPQDSERMIDLSKRAAKELDFIEEGLAKVEMEILEKADAD